MRIGSIGTIKISLMILVISFVLFQAVLVIAQPSWPTEWLTTDCNQDPSDEGNADVDIISVDIVSDGYNPAVYYYVDENYLYLRERIEGNPAGSGGGGMFSQQNWVVLIDNDGDNYYDYLMAVNGNSEEVQIFENDFQEEEIVWDPLFSDDADTLLWSGSTSIYATILSDTLGNWFVSWAVPLDQFTLEEGFILYFATSADANNYNKDHLDCYEEPYCGDGVVGDSEECEPPDTNDNIYCSQTTEECLGARLGTRDEYGDCSLSCGCVYDAFNYQCVQGQCDAECDEDVDCPDKCVGYVRNYDGICDLATTCSCSYDTEDCSSYDGCYAYEDGCEDRIYSCDPSGCQYIYSSRNTDVYDDWVYYCSGLEYRKNRQFHDYYCDGGTCTDHSDWVDDQLVEDCDDGNECTYDYCDPFGGCSNPPKEYGTECGEWRDCPDDVCVGYFAHFYPYDGHDYCNGFGVCLVYSCDMENSYCTDDNPNDGINDLTCGAPCDQDEDCPQTTEMCDYVDKVYCTRDSYGTCDENCDCLYDDWSCNEQDYCLNCDHCGDGIVNCGEECEPGDTDERCMPEGTSSYLCINRTSYQTPEYNYCKETCVWDNCQTKEIVEEDPRCDVQLTPPTCDSSDPFSSCYVPKTFTPIIPTFSFSQPSFSFTKPTFSLTQPSFTLQKPTFSFSTFTFPSLFGI